MLLAAAVATVTTPSHAWRIAAIAPHHASLALAATKDVMCGYSGNACDMYEDADPALLAKLTRGEYDALVGEVRCCSALDWFG